MSKKIINRSELKKIVKKLKKQKKKIITSNGVFDIMHVGYLRFFEYAKEKYGGVLIVGVNSNSSAAQKNGELNSSAKHIKGHRRPFNNEKDRAEIIAALQCVDYVIIFPERDPRKILEIIKPDVHIKDGGYDMKDIIEKDTVEKNNGEVVLIDRYEGYSTTRMAKKIAKL